MPLLADIQHEEAVTARRDIGKDETTIRAGVRFEITHPLFPDNHGRHIHAFTDPGVAAFSKHAPDDRTRWDL